jgi:hypothetical protein
MGTSHSLSQILESAELKLFYGALAAPQLLGHFTCTFLLHKTAYDDAALIRRKAVDELEEHGALFNFVQTGQVGCISPGIHLLFGHILPPVDDRVGGHSVQPCREGRAAPLEALKIGQRLMKHLGGQIFGLFAVVDPPRYESIHTFEVELVKLGEAARVPLCGFDEQPFGSGILARFQQWSPLRHFLTGITVGEGQKLRWLSRHIPIR